MAGGDVLGVRAIVLVVIASAFPACASTDAARGSHGARRLGIADRRAPRR